MNNISGGNIIYDNFLTYKSLLFFVGVGGSSSQGFYQTSNFNLPLNISSISSNQKTVGYSNKLLTSNDIGINVKPNWFNDNVYYIGIKSTNSFPNMFDFFDSFLNSYVENNNDIHITLLKNITVNSDISLPNKLTIDCLNINFLTLSNSNIIDNSSSNSYITFKNVNIICSNSNLFNSSSFNSKNINFYNSKLSSINLNNINLSGNVISLINSSFDSCYFNFNVIHSTFLIQISLSTRI